MSSAVLPPGLELIASQIRLPTWLSLQQTPFVISSNSARCPERVVPTCDETCHFARACLLTEHLPEERVGRDTNLALVQTRAKRNAVGHRVREFREHVGGARYQQRMQS